MKDIDCLIVSSRVRLARNLEGLPFKTARPNAFDAVAATIKARNKGFLSTPISDLGPDMATALFEQHLISKNLLENKVNSLIVVKTADGKGGREVKAGNPVCVMLGEEDHIRIQAIQTGLNLSAAFEEAKKIADDIAHEHDVAFRADFGYLTSCPTNLGTAMRASVMLFLPALTMTHQIDEIVNQLRDRRITVRGVYGEGSAAGGNMYQISNQACLGMSEQQILENVQAIAIQIAKIELNLQAKLYKSDPDGIVDQVFRSWGVLTNAFMLSSAEAMDHLAFLKLGATLGIIDFKNNRILDDLFFIIQPQRFRPKTTARGPCAPATKSGRVG
jgi:protein arginine kinase